MNEYNVLRDVIYEYKSEIKKEKEKENQIKQKIILIK